MYAKTYKDLVLWQKAICLVQEVYAATENFPKTEVYGLTSQMRRAAISIPSNIAEGYKRRNLGEYIQFLSIADASGAELETQIIIAKKIYPSVILSRPESLLEETQKLLCVFIKKLNAKR